MGQGTQGAAPRIRILFIVPSLRLGGAERQVVDLINGLCTERFECHLFTFTGELDLREQLKTGRVQFYNLPKRRKLDLAVVRRIAAIIDGERIDLVHCTLQISFLYAFLARLAASSRPRLLSAIHMTLNRDRKDEILDRLLYSQLMRCASRVIAVCDNQRLYWGSKFPFLAARLVTVHNGVDAELFRDDVPAGRKEALRRRLGICAGELVLGMVAGFRPEKNHEEVLEALALLRQSGAQVRLVLVGDGARREFLEQRARALGVADRVVWAGLIAEPKEYLSIFDVGVLFSFAETFSMAILEYLAMGKPVVAADLGGTSEMLQDGVNGFLVRPRDVAGLAQKLELLYRDQELRRGLAARARESVLGRFTTSRMITETEAVLSALSPPGTVNS